MSGRLLSQVQLFKTLRTVARQASLSMEFSRQEYWSGLPFPPPRDLLDPEEMWVEPEFPALTGGLSFFFFFFNQAFFQSVFHPTPGNKSVTQPTLVNICLTKTRI